MNLIKSSLCACLLIFSISAWAETPICVDGKAAAKIEEKVKLSVDGSEAKDICKAKTHYQTMVEVFTWVKETQFSKPAKKSRYSMNVLGDDLWKYFTDRIHTVIDESKDSGGCNDGAVAYVSSQTDKFVAHICPAFYEYYTTFERAAILLHEARHNEGFSHVMCYAGFKVGNQGGCDTSINEKGSYAVSTELLAKAVMDGIGITAQEKRDLKIPLLISLDSFNEFVGGFGNQGVVLYSAKKRLAYFFDGVDLYPVKLDAKYNHVSRLQSLLGIPKDESSIVGINTFSKNLEKEPVLGSCALDYNKNLGKPQPKLVDILNDGFYGVCVYESRVTGSISTVADNSEGSLDLPFKIKRAFTADEVSRMPRNSLFVLDTNNKYHQITYNETAKTFTVGDSDDPTRGYRNLFFFNNDLSGITKDGRFMRMDIDKMDWVEFPKLKNLRFEDSTRPFYWARDLVE